jgi:hypothetical protein
MAVTNKLIESKQKLENRDQFSSISMNMKPTSTGNGDDGARSDKKTKSKRPGGSGIALDFIVAL